MVSFEATINCAVDFHDRLRNWLCDWEHIVWPTVWQCWLGIRLLRFWCNCSVCVLADLTVNAGNQLITTSSKDYVKPPYGSEFDSENVNRVAILSQQITLDTAMPKCSLENGENMVKPTGVVIEMAMG